VRNDGSPKSYKGQYSTDIISEKALGFLDDAARAVHEKPFFLAIAPIGPHAQVDLGLEVGNETMRSGDVDDSLLDSIKNVPPNSGPQATFSAPIPAERHAQLFSDLQIPRTPNFNPDKVCLVFCFSMFTCL
jgi:hypothetical protein